MEFATFLLHDFSHKIESVCVKCLNISWYVQAVIYNRSTWFDDED